MVNIFNIGNGSNKVFGTARPNTTEISDYQAYFYCQFGNEANAIALLNQYRINVKQVGWSGISFTEFSINGYLSEMMRLQAAIIEDVYYLTDERLPPQPQDNTINITIPSTGVLMNGMAGAGTIPLMLDAGGRISITGGISNMYNAIPNINNTMMLALSGSGSLKIVNGFDSSITAPRSNSCLAVTDACYTGFNSGCAQITADGSFTTPNVPTSARTHVKVKILGGTSTIALYSGSGSSYTSYLSVNSINAIATATPPAPNFPVAAGYEFELDITSNSTASGVAATLVTTGSSSDFVMLFTYVLKM